jgi:3-oxoacyl-[acyl-carrier-protein] synthase II
MQKRRVVITGMGIVSCFGNDIDHFYNQLLAGRSGISSIDRFPCEEYPTRFAGVVRDFDAGDYIEKKQARRVDPFVSYGIVAGKKALESASLQGEAANQLIRVGWACS